MAPVAAPLEARDDNNGEGPSVSAEKRAYMSLQNGHEQMEEGIPGSRDDGDGEEADEGAVETARLAAEQEAEKARLRQVRQEENDKAWTALAAAPKRRWAPTKYRTEPPHPPVIDHRLEEEAAAHQAAQEAGYEGRRVRKFLQRRTVDYNESYLRWQLQRSLVTCARQDLTVRPGVNHVVELLPAAAYRSSAQAVATNLVHSSTNKIRCPVNVIRWTPEGRRLLTGSSSGEYTLWNGLTFNFETILQAHDHAIRAIEYTKSGAWIVSADQGGIIKYFQSNMNNLQMINAHREAVRDLSFSPDDSRFVTASDDSTMKIWSFEEAREESTLKGHGWDVKAVDWHPYKGLLVSGSKDNLVKFWDPRTGTTLATYHGHKGTIQAVNWSNDGNLVATASRDQVLKLYDIRAMAELHTLKGHPNDVCSVTWHPDHRDLLVSGGSEGSILYWSLDAADPATPVHSMLNAHESNVWSLQWHPLGHILGSGSNDHSTRFWERARPEDGRLTSGIETDAQLANKQQRWNKAARGGGEEWDDELSFIPGLGSAKPSQPQQQSTLQPHNGSLDSQGAGPAPDTFMLPGFGGATGQARPPPPSAPPQRPMPNAYAGNMDQPMPGFEAGNAGFVPPPREQHGFVPPPREATGFVPPPRDSNNFARPPPSGPMGGFPTGFGMGVGAGRGYQQQQPFQQQQQQQRGFVPPPRENAGFVPPPRDNAGFVPPPREQGGFVPPPREAGGFVPPPREGAGFGGGNHFQGGRPFPGNNGPPPGAGFVPPPREQQQGFGGPPPCPGGFQPPSGPRGAGRGGYNQGGGGGYYNR